MKTQNSNYEESDDGYVRRNDAPDAKHKSRISWRRMENLQTIRSSVSYVGNRTKEMKSIEGLMMTKWKIYNEDAVEWTRNYQKGKFHALLCDAPYHLTSIVKRYGKTSVNGHTKTEERSRNGADGMARLARGFMGSTWDGGDLAFRPETWEAFGKVLYPGAFGMAFSASRNWHRMAVAIEDAGFILHPTIFLWAYGQGFPKATRIKGQEIFDGHRYGLQALKPAVEPVIVFQKPYEGKPVDSIVETGAGALNIDGTRIPLATGDEYVINEFEDGMKPFGNGAGHKYKSKKIKEDSRLGGKGSWKTDKAAKNVYEGGYAGIDVASSSLGRWASNFILTEESAERLDAQGVDKFVSFTYNIEKIFKGDIICGSTLESQKEDGTSSGEIREVEKYILNVGQFIFGNQSTETFQKDLTFIISMGIKLMTDLQTWNLRNHMNTENCMEVLEQTIRLLMDMNSENAKNAWSTKKLQIFIQEKRERLMAIARNVSLSICESGEGTNQITSQSTCENGENRSRFFYQVSTQLDESDPVYYCAKVSPKERNAGLEEKNPHPTLKPIDLCKYLATLLLPPVDYAPRRIFIPFSGVASEMIGAGLAGWEHVVGVEFDKENNYVDIAEKRLEHWLK